MADIAGWIDRAQPELVIVDVSVEVALLSRRMGVPVIVVALPGERTDPAHRLGYDLAEAILACWPPTVPTPVWPSTWVDKTWFVGAMSRYDSRTSTGAGEGPGPPPASRPTPRRRAILLLGAGGN